jgi:signal transduction histidine kinase
LASKVSSFETVLARARAERGDVDELLGQLDHELRGPLASIANWLHLLSTNRGDSALQEQGLAAIDQALKAQTKLLDSLRRPGKD